MGYNTLIRNIPGWMRPDGPDAGIVISSRARLARNISGAVYAHRAADDKLKEIADSIIEAAEGAGFNRSGYFRIEELSDLQKSVFIERHLASPALTKGDNNRGVLVGEGEFSSILVNEEDHLRIQSLSSGFNPVKAWEEVDGIDDRMSRAVPFSFSKSYGYLTACPTNFGTGLRVSVLIHLPALVITKDIQRMIRSSAPIGLVVRGYYGEGSDVIGNLFQISNGSSLGKSEREIVATIENSVRKIIEYEKRAADTLMNDARLQIEDKVFRSAGILKSARVLSTGEFMNLGSAVRLGVTLGILSKPDMRMLNELLIVTQPAHLQARNGKEVDSAERDVLRAAIVREHFIDVRT